MIFKIVTLFLVGIAVLAMFGRLRVPSLKKKARKMLSRTRCAACGAPRVGKSPCPCGGPGQGRNERDS